MQEWTNIKVDTPVLFYERISRLPLNYFFTRRRSIYLEYIGYIEKNSYNSIKKGCIYIFFTRYLF